MPTIKGIQQKQNKLKRKDHTPDRQHRGQQTTHWIYHTVLDIPHQQTTETVYFPPTTRNTTDYGCS